MKKLILFGDSLFGRCSKSEVLSLEDKLGNEYDVYNCATGGWDSADLVKKSEFIANLKPDVMVLSVGTNDVCSWKRVEIDAYKGNIQVVLDIFKQTRVIFFLPPPVNEESRPLDKQILNSEVKTYNEAAKNICISNDIEYLDSWNMFIPLLTTKKSYHIDDGVHFNDYGYEVLFKELSRIILS